MTLVSNAARAGGHTSTSGRLHFHSPGCHGHDDSLLFIFSSHAALVAAASVPALLGNASLALTHPAKDTFVN